MNSASNNNDNASVAKDIPVTVFMQDLPDQYFFGVADVYESGDLNLYTNGRIAEDEKVVIKPHENSEEETKQQDYEGRIQSINLSSNPNHMYTYQYSVQCNDG